MTHEKPTEPGWYHCDLDFGNEIVEITRNNDGELIVRYIGSSDWSFLDALNDRPECIWGPRIDVEEWKP